MRKMTCRFKKIYLKVVVVFVVIFWVLSYLRNTGEDIDALVDNFLSDNRSLIEEHYEGVLLEYERKIIPNLGHMGEPAYLEGKDAKDGEEALKTFALNSVLSDRLPLNRLLRDPRNPGCKKFKYNPKLKASVIIIFYNELLSVILRTIWSVILQTPSNLLEEIILVDDCSTTENLQGLLEYYLKTRLSKYKVRLIRQKNRMGLIRARLQGARAAKGDVLLFLDSHCEATKDYMQPLLARIEEDRTAVLVPIIDVIESNTFAYSTNGDTSFQVGGFTWSGHFTWIDIQSDEDKGTLKPVKTPTMAGGLLAIDRKYFWDVGSYDEQMDGWGGENLEMSFRIWQCGGRIETVPCSRIGHVFRDFHPYSFPDNKDTHAINTARLVEVWMDEYKQFFYYHQPRMRDVTLIGDLTHRKQLRQKLRCKSFKWYLRNVYPEKFIPNENVIAHGQVKTVNNNCLDDLQIQDESKAGPLGLYVCHPFMAMSQYFSLSHKGELRNEKFCAEVFGERDVKLTQCHGHKREQLWMLKKDGHLYNPSSRKCLSSFDVKIEGGLVVEGCKRSPYQKWEFVFTNKTSLD